MVKHGIPWYTMVYHGIPWYIIDIPWYHGTPWYDHVVTHRGCTTVYHGVPWYTVVYHGTPWYTMVYHCTTTMCYDTVVYHSLYTVLTTRIACSLGIFILTLRSRA